jgi:hypothetical protein
LICLISHILVIFFCTQGAKKILFYYPENEDENKKVLNVGHIEAVICFARYANKLYYIYYYSISKYFILCTNITETLMQMSHVNLYALKKHYKCYTMRSQIFG